MRTVLAILLCLTVVGLSLVMVQVWPYPARAGTSVVVEWQVNDPHLIVDMALPGVHEREPRPGRLLTEVLGRAVGVDFTDYRSMVASQLPVRVDEVSTPAAVVRHEPDTVDIEKDRREGAVLVGIYHTHTGETYSLTDEVERFDGRPGGVVEVGRVLAEELRNRHGIPTVHTDRVHDVPYAASYLESFRTAQEMLDEHRSIRILLDIHRDSKKQEEHRTVQINGESCASVLVIVGSNARQPFPGWEDNLELARKLAATADRLYPGLISGLRVQDGRYNQYLHPGALLLEVGAVNGHTEEALRSAGYLADVIALLLDNWESS